MRGPPKRGGGGLGRQGSGPSDEAILAGSAVKSQCHTARSSPAAGGVFKSAAVEVLRRTRRLMTTGEICRLALEWGLLSCSGKTPEATMASAMYGDIKRKDRHSLFIRPQEGMFGLLEWVDQGFLPLWCLDTTASACTYTIAPGVGAPIAPSFPSCTAAPGFGPSSCYGSSNGMGMLPLAVAAAVATSPAKRSAPSGPAPHQAAKRGPGRPRKVRHSRATPSEDEEWSDEGGQATSDSELGGASGHDRLEPKQYSLRRGQVGRLQEAGSAATATTTPRRHGSIHGPSVLTSHLSAQGTGPDHAQQTQHCWQQPKPEEQQQEQNAALGSLAPLDLPNLRPASAEGSQSQGQRRSGNMAGMGGVAGSLLSPSICAALLQSPLCAPAFSGRADGLSGLFSPGTRLPDFVSPGLPSPLLAALGCTSSLLSPLNPPEAAPGGNQAPRPSSAGSALQQRRVVVALKGAAAAAAHGGAREAAGGVAAAMMVPLSEVAAGVAGAALAAQHAAPGHHHPLRLASMPSFDPYQQLPHRQQQQQQHGMAFASVGESAGVVPLQGTVPVPPPAGNRLAQLGAHVPEIIIRLPAPAERGAKNTGGCTPGTAAGSGINGQPVAGVSSRVEGPSSHAEGGAAPGNTEHGAVAGAASGAGEPAGGGGAAAADHIVRRIREVECKVQQVEERWGPASVKTAQAHFLLHRACRHPQAAATFQREAAQALHRAHSILQQYQVQGLVECQSAEFLSIACSVREALGAAAAVYG